MVRQFGYLLNIEYLCGAQSGGFALVVQWIEWEIPNFQIGVRFPSEVLICSFIFCLLGRRSHCLWLAVLRS